MWFAFFVRSGPINLDGIENNVRSSTYSQIQEIISQQIDSEYPNLNAAYKQELVQKEYQKVVDTGVFEMQGQKIVVEDIVQQNSAILKNSFKADNGQTYLTEMDSHYFFHLATNYYENGHTGDTLVNGEPVVTTKFSPQGQVGTYNPQFQIWIESKLFALNGLSKNSTDGERTKAIYLLPVILSMLSAIPAYFLIRKFSNDLFAFFGSLTLVSIGTYVSRTVAGFVDTDPYNVLFPLLIVLFLVYAFVYKNYIAKIIFAIFAGFFLGFFIWAWGSGWFIFVFILIALIGYLGFAIISHFLIKEKETTFFGKIKNDLITLVLFVLSSLLFTYVFIGQNIFKLTYQGITGSVSEIASISTVYIWPNVLSSVAELNPASFPQIISSVGGNIIFVIAMLGILMLVLDYIKVKNEKFSLFNKLLIFFSIIWFIAIVNSGLFLSLTANNPKLFVILLFLPIGIAFVSSLFNQCDDHKIFFAMVLSVWTAGTIYMSFSGVRFILLLAPAFCAAFGLGLYYFSKTINDFVKTEFDVEHKVKKVVAGFIFATILFFILFIPIATQANAISKGTTPTFDDVWYNSMYKIKNESNENAIITSWWDFGHFYSAISHRGSTFDGGSQGTPQAHWVGKLFMENDEEISHDILQMLVCGGNLAHEAMLNSTPKTTADAVKVNKIIYSTFGKSQEEKIQILKENKYYNYDDKQIENIMSYLACDIPRENYVLTSEDMTGKAGVWAHWGSWDFTKKYVYDNYQTKTVEQIAFDIDENTTLIEKYVTELKELDKTSISQNIKRDNLINSWLAPYPSYIPIQNRYQYSCQTQNTTLVCQNGISIDMMTGAVSSTFSADVKFANLVYPNQDGNISVVRQSEDGDIDVILIPGSTGFNVMLAQYPLGNSLFTKLFYLNGYGTTKFEKFDEQQSITGIKFSIWKVNWSDVNSVKSENISLNK